MKDWIIVLLMLTIIFGCFAYLFERISVLQTDIIIIQSELGNAICLKVSSDSMNEDN
jgi:hypothetical protein